MPENSGIYVANARGFGVLRAVKGPQAPPSAQPLLLALHLFRNLIFKLPQTLFVQTDKR